MKERGFGKDLSTLIGMYVSNIDLKPWCEEAKRVIEVTEQNCLKDLCKGALILGVVCGASKEEMKSNYECMQYNIPKELWNDLKSRELMNPEAPID